MCSSQDGYGNSDDSTNVRSTHVRRGSSLFGPMSHSALPSPPVHFAKRR
jgi:hypothetical protein